MKLLYVGHTFPNSVGGPALQFVYEARALSKRGHRVRMVSYRLRLGEGERKGLRIDRRIPPGVAVRIALDVASPPHLFRYSSLVAESTVSALLEEIEDFAPSLIVTNFSSPREVLQALIGFYFKSVPYVLQFHGTDVAYYAQLPQFERLYKLAFSQAKGIVAVSEFVKKELVDLGVPSTRVRVFYPLIDCKWLKEYSKEKVKEFGQKWSENGSYKIVGYLGRISFAKGLDLLLEAVAMLLKRGIKIKLVMVGEGDVNSVLKRANDLEILKYVVHIPYIEHPGAVLKAFDFLVLPSKCSKHSKEAFGRVLAEAMCLGIPVIGSTCGGIYQDVIGENERGFIFKDGDALDLARVIVEVLSVLGTTDLQRKVDIARRWAIRNCSVTTQINLLESFYEKAAGIRS